MKTLEASPKGTPLNKLAVIGAGVSGLSVAQLLKDRYAVTVFEKEDRPGGLIRCRRVNGSLFHTCGGHVFNSKRQDVLDWFWSFFHREEEFAKADRHACVFLDRAGTSPAYDQIPYPLENHVYLLDPQTQKSFYEDLDEIDRVKGLLASLTDYDSFGDFLRWRFGKTLYHLYFQPYNEKVWRRDLTAVPMSWMEGKLPMPTTQEMRDNNAQRIEEKSFVHSTFWYEKRDGSQWIANRLAKGLSIRYHTDVHTIRYLGNRWEVDGEAFDRVVFCGSVKEMIGLIDGVDLTGFTTPVSRLAYHGTTAVFCEIDRNPYSWIYQPSHRHQSHRIICTGNFAPSNNGEMIPSERITATIEFTDEISREDIQAQLEKIPLHPVYLDHQYHAYTYPIQDAGTRSLIRQLKKRLAPLGFHFTGRFADWEYYNMDAAMGAAMDLCRQL